MTSGSYRELAAPLETPHLRLEQLSPAHVRLLSGPFLGDTDMWRWMLVCAPQSDDDVRAWVDEALARAAEESQASFVIRAADGTALGTTRFLDIRRPDEGLEIGWTMMFAAGRGTFANSLVKLRLVERAFENGFSRVQLKTDARNVRSRAAIAAIGGRFEGVLRSYQRRADGTLRDTAMFSIVAAEWPGVRERLEARVNERLQRSRALHEGDR